MAKASRCCSLVASAWSQPPTFLAPALARSVSRPSQSFFSTTSALGKRTRDRNPKRGVSALRGTGPRHPLSVSGRPLPKPVLDPARRTKLKSDPDHGLWQFFGKDRGPLMTPEEVGSHGRAWSVEELRSKSWEDLHALWWVCAKERNRISTMEFERRRVDAGYGEHEADTRDNTVRTTQKAIKHVLSERWYAWQDAWSEVNKDPRKRAMVQDAEHVSPCAELI